MKDKDVGPEEERTDNPVSSVAEGMPRRQAVQLTTGVTHLRDGHDTGAAAKNRNESAGKTPGEERKIPFIGGKVLLTRTEEESHKGDTIEGRQESGPESRVSSEREVTEGDSEGWKTEVEDKPRIQISVVGRRSLVKASR